MPLVCFHSSGTEPIGRSARTGTEIVYGALQLRISMKILRGDIVTVILTLLLQYSLIPTTNPITIGLLEAISIMDCSRHSSFHCFLRVMTSYEHTHSLYQLHPISCCYLTIHLLFCLSMSTSNFVNYSGKSMNQYYMDSSWGKLNFTWTVTPQYRTDISAAVVSIGQMQSEGMVCDSIRLFVTRFVILSVCCDHWFIHQGAGWLRWMDTFGVCYYNLQFVHVCTLHSFVCCALEQVEVYVDGMGDCRSRIIIMTMSL